MNVGISHDLTIKSGSTPKTRRCSSWLWASRHVQNLRTSSVSQRNPYLSDTSIIYSPIIRFGQDKKKVNLVNLVGGFNALEKHTSFQIIISVGLSHQICNHQPEELFLWQMVADQIELVQQGWYEVIILRYVHHQRLAFVGGMGASLSSRSSRLGVKHQEPKHSQEGPNDTKKPELKQRPLAESWMHRNRNSKSWGWSDLKIMAIWCSSFRTCFCVLNT